MNSKALHFFILTALSLFIFLLAKAQQDSLVYFFDKNYNSCNRDVAYYVGIGTKNNSLWQFDCYINETGIKVTSGSYRDSLLNNAEGLFNYYFEDGTLSSTGNYHLGKETGLWKKWDNAGHLIDSMMYENGKITTEVSWRYYNGELQNYRYTNALTKESKAFEYHNNILLRESNFIGKSGEIKEYYANGKVSIYQKFENDKIKIVRRYNENGEEVKPEQIKNQVQIPEFPGGEGALQRWMDNELRTPDNLKPEMRFNQTATIMFKLDERGRVIDVSITGVDASDLTMFLKNRIERMPNWIMHGFKTWGPVTLTLRII
jgi:antitoxin component YwqK of YwqJK toxin-antitoxin module